MLCPSPSVPSFFPLSFGQVAFGILGPQPGVKPAPPAVEAQSINNRAIREVTFIYLCFGHGVQDLPHPGIKLVPTALGTWSLNQWTSRESWISLFLFIAVLTPPVPQWTYSREFFFFFYKIWPFWSFLEGCWTCFKCLCFGQVEWTDRWVWISKVGLGGECIRFKISYL